MILTSCQIFFGAVTTVGSIWVFFCVPETKGRTLEEMDEIFGTAGLSQADVTRKETIERDIGLTALLSGEDPSAIVEKPEPAQRTSS